MPSRICCTRPTVAARDNKGSRQQKKTNIYILPAMAYCVRCPGGHEGGGCRPRSVGDRTIARHQRGATQRRVKVTTRTSLLNPRSAGATEVSWAMFIANLSPKTTLPCLRKQRPRRRCWRRPLRQSKGVRALHRGTPKISPLPGCIRAYQLRIYWGP